MREATAFASRRNLRTIAREVDAGRWTLRGLDRVLHRKLVVVSEIYRQQLHLYRTRDRSIPDRIVSVSQPHVRPIVRGKASAPTEFGAKISVSLVGDYAMLDRLSWDAYYEGADLPQQADAFRARTGQYPAVIYADKAYTTRANRAWSLNRIMAKLACTSACVIALVFLVMNLEALLTPMLILLLAGAIAAMGIAASTGAVTPLITMPMPGRGCDRLR